MYKLKTILFSILVSITFFAQPALGQIGNQIINDETGNSYVAGKFTNKLLNFGKYKLENRGGSDIFIAKYDSHGKILWAENIGGLGNEKLNSINIDNSGNLSISVSSESQEIYTPGTTLINNSGKMNFKIQFSADGNLLQSNINGVSPAFLKTAQDDTAISVISPGPGDNWKVGTKGTIVWESENINSVLIELSTDNGDSWEQLYIADIFDFESEYNLIVPNIHSNACLVRVSDSDNPNRADTSGVFSISGELFWEVKENDFSSVLISSFITSSMTGWMAGFNGLIKTTNFGETWSSYLNGYGLLDIFFLNDSVGWTVGLSGLIFKTTNGGGDWIEQDSVISSYLLKIFFADEDSGYMIGGNNFLKTTNGGESWEIQQPSEHILMTMYFADNDEGWIAGNEGVILRTTDAGISWVEQQINGTEYGTLTSLFFLDKNRGYASGSGLDVSGGVILKTTDGGDHWNLMHNGYNRFVFSVRFTSSDTGWAAGDEGIMFNTTNGGEDWELQGSGTFDDLLSLNFKSYNVGWTVGNNGIILKYHPNPIDPPVPVELYSFEALNQDGEIMLSWITATEINNKGFEIERNSADEWMNIGFVQGKGTTTLSQSYSFSDKNIIPGNYFYRLKQINYDGSFEYSKTLNVRITPQFSFKLEQNYPNPFNPSTTINFSVQKNVLVSLIVYDALGSEVATLVNEEKPAGDYLVNFNASGISSGTYFFVLKAGDFINAKKMLLIK
ncbi:MAG: YCF48-related protein [Ignavibacteria bacterium]